MTKSAVMSECGRYRYRLGRRWHASGGAHPENVLFIMLNPSTADETIDDPTIRKCIGFARQWGFYGLTVVNLFALRATNPKELRNADDPVGPANDAAILSAIQDHATIVAAWGGKAFEVNHRPRTQDDRPRLPRRSRTVGMPRAQQGRLAETSAVRFVREETGAVHMTSDAAKDGGG